MAHESTRLGKAHSVYADDYYCDDPSDGHGQSVGTVKPEDCGFTVTRDHPEYTIYEMEGTLHSWMLLVQKGYNAEDMLGEIFNYMISKYIIALYIDGMQLQAMRQQLKGMLH